MQITNHQTGQEEKRIIPSVLKPEPHAAVLYLSPMLEEKPKDIVVAVVAHELAHIVLGHRLHFLTPDEDDRQEQEVRRRILKWGFEKEERKHAALCKQRDSMA